MKTHKILQKKQENGLWETPMNCISIDRLASDKRKEILQSAAISMINQMHNCTFKIVNSTDNGFMIELYKEQSYLRLFEYKYYEVVDDTIYEFENEIEHISFLRKQKLNQLENI